MDLLHNLKLGWYKSATLVHLFGTYIFFVLFIHIIQIVSKNLCINVTTYIFFICLYTVDIPGMTYFCTICLTVHMFNLQPIRRRRQAAVPLRWLRHMPGRRPRPLLPLRAVQYVPAGAVAARRP